MFRLTGRKRGIRRLEGFKQSRAERLSGGGVPYSLIVERRGREGLKERERET